MSSLGRPLTFDLTGDPEPPSYLVDGLIEKGTVTLLAGDSGAGKSLICQSLVVSLVQGKPWLGRRTHGRNVMVIDEENAHRLVQRRMRALGLTQSDLAGVQYYCRNGIMVDDPATASAVHDEAEAFDADIIILDTVGAMIGFEIQDNNRVPPFFARVLRPLTESGCAVLVLAHPRKPPPGQKPGPIKYDLMGAGQWRYQADAMLSLNAVGDKVHSELQPDGTSIERWPVQLANVKQRDGTTWTERIDIVSQRDDHGLKWMRVEGIEAGKRDQWRMNVELVIGQNGRSMSVADLAEALNTRAESPALMRGLRAMEAQGRLKLTGGVLYLA